MKGPGPDSNRRVIRGGAGLEVPSFPNGIVARGCSSRPKCIVERSSARPERLTSSATLLGIAPESLTIGWGTGVGLTGAMLGGT